MQNLKLNKIYFESFLGIHIGCLLLIHIDCLLLSTPPPLPNSLVLPFLFPSFLVPIFIDVFFFSSTTRKKKRKLMCVFRFSFPLTYKTTKGKTKVDFRFLVFSLRLHTKRQKEKRKLTSLFRVSFSFINKTTKEITEV